MQTQMHQSIIQPLKSVFKEVSLEWVIPNGLKILCEPIPLSQKFKIYDSPIFTTADPTIRWKLFFNCQTYEDGKHPLDQPAKEKDKEPKANFDNLENWSGHEIIKAKKQFVYASVEVEKINDSQLDVFVDELNIYCGIHKTIQEPELICEIAKGGIECRWIEMRSKNPEATYCKFAKHSPVLDSAEPSKTYPKHTNCDIIFRFKGKIYTGK